MRIETSNMLKSLRKGRGLTQEQLGVLSGMSKSQISRMEKGVLGSPETVDRLLASMGYRLMINYVDLYADSTDERGRILDMLRSFVRFNAEKYGIESMALFGSVARNEQTENSDVDLLVKLKRPSFYLYSEIRTALESVLKRNVDIVSASARMRTGFEEEIAKDLIYVQ